MKWHFSILSFFFLIITYGQENQIRGRILDSYGVPIPFANIIVNDNASPSKTITYGYSDNKGEFRIDISENLEIVFLNITCIGYVEKSVSYHSKSNKYLEINIETSVTKLKEVVIEARQLRDTLKLDIKNMNLSKDDNLRKMLEKTGGVILSEDGSISYQGKQINRVLVNGKEVFVNQNKVALDNITYDIMKGVQVINNYKDKFSLDFDRIRSPVINIETKSEFKGVLKAEIDLGYGHKKNYLFGGKGFFFSDKINAFLTSNSNNFGKKEFSQKDISTPIQQYASPALRGLLSPFFETNQRARKSFISSSSITLRKEKKNSKSGIVLYYGATSNEVLRSQNIFIGDTLIRKSHLDLREEGHFVSATINHVQKLSSKTVLQNIFSSVITTKENNNMSLDSLFSPNLSFFLERTKIKPSNFSVVNSLKVTSLLNYHTSFNINLDFYQENISNNLDTQLINSTTPKVIQKEDFSKQHFSFNPNFKFKLKNASLNLGGNLISRREKAILNNQGNLFGENKRKRHLVISELLALYKGYVGKLDYNFSFTPTLIYSEKSNNSTISKMSHTLVYNFETQKKISIGFRRRFYFQDLTMMFDTIIKSVNNIVVSDIKRNDGFSVKDIASFSWFNNNVAKSKSTFFIYNYSKENNFLQSTLDSVSNNIFFYSNRVFDDKHTHNINLGIKKGFYLGSKLNRLDLSGGLKFSFTDYPTIFSGLETDANITSWEPSIAITYVPRKIFIREITNVSKYRPQIFRVGDVETNRQTIFNNRLTIEGGRQEINWSVDFDYQFYNVQQDNFGVLDLNLLFGYEVSDKFKLSLKGQSILSLFKINNFNSVNTLSNGNVVTQTFNNNNLGFLLLNATIKL
ncbi:hypothetical protein A8C32_03105 [Flavivirga aquatica]|uniref:TonB-dependent receptor n=1 Tax=Flavivirga aquatica TaxID=1849968 RepID=A0A1E5TAP4_9FLAO|nr:carboxypeptidase-like regulatory domain-containing protein [Flavivirga aquatica]OEK08452.1 hypothetical protein A8C32_03105 [Flavivirga aquatica]